MYKIIKEALKTTDLTIFNITRGEFKAPCLVVNSSLIASLHADNELISKEYLVNINLILSNNIEIRKEEIEKLLRSHNFKEIRIMPSLQDSEGIFNTPIKAKYIKERR